jgi:hypothetical protein
MRVLQVVALISPDGSYGGPARVALNQSAELVKRGHEVTLAAATRGFRVPPSTSISVAIWSCSRWRYLPGGTRFRTCCRRMGW